MKVWIIEAGEEHEEYHVVGVFSTRERAMTAAYSMPGFSAFKFMEPTHSYENMAVLELADERIVIIEYEVDEGAAA